VIAKKIAKMPRRIPRHCKNPHEVRLKDSLSSIAKRGTRTWIREPLRTVRASWGRIIPAKKASVSMPGPNLVRRYHWYRKVKKRLSPARLPKMMDKGIRFERSYRNLIERIDVSVLNSMG
jgi:hypothetical protein